MPLQDRAAIIERMLPKARANILEAIGKTPLVKLNRIGSDCPADIYVKCEYLNPGGSMNAFSSRKNTRRRP